MFDKPSVCIGQCSIFYAQCNEGTAIYAADSHSSQKFGIYRSGGAAGIQFIRYMPASDCKVYSGRDCRIFFYEWNLCEYFCTDSGAAVYRIKDFTA